MEAGSDGLLALETFQGSRTPLTDPLAKARPTRKFVFWFSLGAPKCSPDANIVLVLCGGSQAQGADALRRGARAQVGGARRAVAEPHARARLARATRGRLPRHPRLYRGPPRGPSSRPPRARWALQHCLTKLFYFAALQIPNGARDARRKGTLARGTRRVTAERAAAQAGHGADEILVAGGATRSPLWLQMHADVTGLPVVPHCPKWLYKILKVARLCSLRRVPCGTSPLHQRGRGRVWEDRSPSARVQTARSSVRARAPLSPPPLPPVLTGHVSSHLPY